MVSEVDIVNKAFLRLGADTVESPTGNVADITTVSLNAKLAKLNYEVMRDVVLSDRVWSFALKKVVNDTPIVDEQPAFGFSQAFAKPDDSINIWRVDRRTNTGVLPTVNRSLRNDMRFNMNWRLEGQRILADANAINIQYIAVVSDTELFPAKFIDAFSIRLAVEFCIAITENDRLWATLGAEYEERLKSAGAIDGQQARHEFFVSNQLKSVR